MTSPTAQRGANPPSALHALVPVLRDIVGPYVVYFVLRHFAHWTNLAALIAAAVASLLLVLLSVLRNRRIDALAGVVLVTLVAAIVVAWWTGDARLTLARDAIISGGLGVTFLLSLTFRQPLMFSLVQSLRGQRDPQAWDNTPPRRRSALRTVTAVWGVGLLLDAGIRIALVAILSVDQAATAVTALTIVTVVVLVGWMRFYLTRQYTQPPAT